MCRELAFHSGDEAFNQRTPGVPVRGKLLTHVCPHALHLPLHPAPLGGDDALSLQGRADRLMGVLTVELGIG
jgi:hypothetical protein